MAALGDSLVPDQNPASSADEAYWTRARLELRAWLQRNAPSLAELYEGAVRLAYGMALPGRVRFISHAVREIRNRLPEAISGIKSGIRLDYKSRMDMIGKAWNKHDFSLGGSIPSTPDVVVPLSFLRLVEQLIKDHEETRERPIEAATRLFEGLAPENQRLRNTLRPTVEQWVQVTGWFMQRAHDSGKGDASYDEDDLRRRFELFEATLGAVSRNFFSTVAELDEILEDANS